MWLMSKAEEAFKSAFGKVYEIERFGLTYRVTINATHIKVQQDFEDDGPLRTVWETDSTYEKYAAMLMVYGFGEIQYETKEET